MRFQFDMNICVFSYLSKPGRLFHLLNFYSEYPGQAFGHRSEREEDLIRALNIGFIDLAKSQAVISYSNR